jgi:hypothetical protein
VAKLALGQADVKPGKPILVSIHENV